MKTEHTPGPWEVDSAADVEHMAACLAKDSGTDREWVAVDSGEQGGHVAYCHPLNAALIAAAPELLDALRAILLDGEYNNEGDFVIRRADDDETDTSEPPCLRDAGAAIAKAEGRA
jgi:hypothetical protein